MPLLDQHLKASMPGWTTNNFAVEPLEPEHTNEPRNVRLIVAIQLH
jgi:hypothetical protein